MSLYDITSGKKLDSVYDITTGKKLAKVYEFTPSGYSLVYQMFKKLWETNPQAYQLLNLQTDSTGNLYPVLSGLGFQRLQASDGSVLATGSETSAIVGDLNIDETNAFITYVTTGTAAKHWGKNSYSDLTNKYQAIKNNSYSFTDAIALKYPINSYQSSNYIESSGNYDLYDNSKASNTYKANISAVIGTGDPVNTMALDGFGSNSSFALGTALAYNESTVFGWYLQTNTQYTTYNNDILLLTSDKIQYTPVGYAPADTVSAGVIANFYVALVGSSAYVVEMYQSDNETYITKVATYTPTNTIVSLINDVDKFDKEVTAKSSTVLIGDKLSNEFTFYTVEQSNQGATNNLNQVTYNPGVDAHLESSDPATFSSKILDSWDSYTAVRGVKKGSQLSVGTSVTIAPYSYTINSSIPQYANAIDSQLVTYWGGNNNQITQINADGTVRSIWDGMTSGTTTGGIDVDSEDNIYVGASDGSLYKLGRQLNLIWKKTCDSKINDVSIATGDYIYVGTHDGTIYQFDTDGNVNWTVTLDSIVNDLDTANDGSVYAVSTVSAYHYDKSGTQLLKYTGTTSQTGLSPSRIACTKSGDHFYINAAAGYWIVQISSSGSVTSSKSFTYAINSIICDDNYVYFTLQSIAASYIRSPLSLLSTSEGATNIGCVVNELALDGVGGIYLAAEDGTAKRQMTDLTTTTKYASKVISYQVG